MCIDRFRDADFYSFVIRLFANDVYNYHSKVVVEIDRRCRSFPHRERRVIRTLFFLISLLCKIDHWVGNESSGNNTSFCRFKRLSGYEEEIIIERKNRACYGHHLRVRTTWKCSSWIIDYRYFTVVWKNPGAYAGRRHTNVPGIILKPLAMNCRWTAIELKRSLLAWNSPTRYHDRWRTAGGFSLYTLFTTHLLSLFIQKWPQWQFS